MSFETEFTIEFGDCDYAGIVFYPNYFYWFDCTFQRWLRSVGLSHRELKQRWGAITPLLDVGASFKETASFDQGILIKGRIEEWAERRFKCLYTIEAAGRVIVTGHELRAWAVSGPDGKLKSAAIAPEFRRLME